MKIVHLTLYPNKPSDKYIPQSGVSTYSQNLIKEIQKNLTKQNSQIVFANILDKKESYIEDEILIVRNWEKGVKFFHQIIFDSRKFDFDIIHFQQELSLFGGYISVPFLIILTFFFKLIHKKIIITFHGVPNITDINDKFAKENNTKLPAWFVKISTKFIFSSLGYFADKIIVHENIFKNYLTRQYYLIPETKVITIQHGVIDFKKLDKVDARKYLKLPLDKKIFLFMGYLTGYKGLELLIDSFTEFSKLHQDVYLVIGAGIHPKLKNDKAYLENVYSFHQKKAENISNDKYCWVGYIPEELVGSYYSAVDLVVFPYTVAMSSSGPMAIAIGYETPFIASNVFRHFVQNSYLLFERNVESLKMKLEDFVKFPELFAKESQKLKTKLLWKNIAPKYINVYKNL